MKSHLLLLFIVILVTSCQKDKGKYYGKSGLILRVDDKIIINQEDFHHAEYHRLGHEYNSEEREIIKEIKILLEKEKDNIEKDTYTLLIENKLDSLSEILHDIKHGGEYKRLLKEHNQIIEDNSPNYHDPVVKSKLDSITNLVYQIKYSDEFYEVKSEYEKLQEELPSKPLFTEERIKIDSLKRLLPRIEEDCYIINENNKFNPFLLEKHLYSNSEFQNLITNWNNIERNDLVARQDLACGYCPRHAILLKNSFDEVVSIIEICFSCKEIRLVEGPDKSYSRTSLHLDSKQYPFLREHFDKLEEK